MADLADGDSGIVPQSQGSFGSLRWRGGLHGQGVFQSLAEQTETVDGLFDLPSGERVLLRYIVDVRDSLADLSHTPSLVGCSGGAVLRRCSGLI